MAGPRIRPAGLPGPAAGGSVQEFQRRVSLEPRNPLHRADLGAALLMSGRPSEAAVQLAEAIRVDPALPEAHCNMALAMERLGCLEQALAHGRRAIAIRPDYPEALFNLGSALAKGGHYAEGMTAWRRARALRPDLAARIDQRLAACALMLEDVGEAILYYRNLIINEPRSVSAQSALLYLLHCLENQSAEHLYREHQEWGRLFCDPLAPLRKRHDNDRDPLAGSSASYRRLRIGYVSPDFREHTVPHFITAAIEHHNRETFEVFCYSDVDKPDAITEKLRSMADHWRDILGQSDEAAETLIRQDSIDILIDLRGHAAANRLTLFARKPTPLQANMVGYFNTTGLSTMDWRITDSYMDPPGQTERFHTEKLMRLPGSCWCYTPADDAPPVGDLPALHNGFVTFGSLNKIIKVSRPCAEMWGKVLAGVPGSKLMLSLASPDAIPQVRQRLAEAGISPERLLLPGKTATGREYLKRFNQIDIALDTFPFNGITTTCDGLWMGVPAVSLSGGISVSRAGRSILHAAGLGELATDTPERFVETAVKLAADLSALRTMRLTMRERLNGSPLMDASTFAGNLESAFRAMWKNVCTEPAGS